MTATGGGGLARTAELAKVLENCRCLQDPVSRALFLEFMSQELGALPDVREHKMLRLFVLDLASTCLRSEPTMRALIDVLSVFKEEPAEEVRYLARQLVAEPAFAVKELARLRMILQGIDVPELAGMCREIVGQLREIPPFFDVWTAFEALQQMNADPGGLPPALALIEYVAVEAEHRRLRALRDWSDAQAEGMGVLPQLRSLRQRVSYASRARPVDAYLVVRLEPQEDAGSYLLTSWHQYDPHDPAGWHPQQGESVVVTLETAERAVQDLVYEAEAGWANEAACIHVEFELGPEELHLPVHLWRKELDSETSSPLCVDYPVVVRSLQRARMPRWHRPWKQRWQTLVTHPERMRGAIVGGDSPDHPGRGDPGVLEAWLKADESIGCLVLSSSPERDLDGSREALMGLRAGLPVLVWDQRDQGGNLTGGRPLRNFDESIAMLAVRNLPQLREGMRKLRQDAQSDSTEDRQRHVGHHVALLWDDPTRPVGADGPLTGPDQGVDGL